MKIDSNYAIEKIEAYNVAITALELHEPSDGNLELAYRLRMNLRNKLQRELQKWINENYSKYQQKE